MTVKVGQEGSMRRQLVENLAFEDASISIRDDHLSRPFCGDTNAKLVEVKDRQAMRVGFLVPPHIAVRFDA